MSAQVQSLLMISAAAGSGAIDSYTAGLWGAYGLTRLVGAYAGSAIRVRRSSDNTEQDIGFSGSALDTSALSSFVGANDGFVTKIYDQSGGGNDIAQSTSAAQPQIVDAGTYMGAVYFDGVDDNLITSNNSSALSAYSVVVAGRNRIGGSNFSGLSATQIEHIVRHNAGGGGLYTFFHNDGADRMVLVGSTQSGAANCENGAISSRSTFAVSADLSQATVGAELSVYSAGSALTHLSDNGTQMSGTFTADKWKVGGYSASEFARLELHGLLIYEASKSAGDIAAINTAIKPANFLKDTLDSYTTNLWGLYSLRRLRSAYSGSAIRVRRSSDNTEQDVGFSAGYLDTTSLLTFCGSGSGYVTKWYDQSGNGRDFAQSTQANQPSIVSSGAVQKLLADDDAPGITFDGSNDGFSTSATLGTGISAISFYAKARHTNPGTSFGNLIELSGNYNTANSLIVYIESSQTAVGSHRNSPSGYARNDFNANPCGQVLAAVVDRGEATSAAQCKLYSGGRELTRATDGATGTLPAGDFDNATLHLGARNGGALGSLSGAMETIAIYSAANNAATVERISRAIG